MPTAADIQSPLLAHLNASQRAAVTSAAPALLVIAGAGTGKTRVLTHRIAWLIGTQNVHPASILAATFTNKAASEMMERIDALTGGQARSLTMGTFHRICTRILRDFDNLHIYGRNFAIYDQSEQLAVIKQAMKELELDTAVWKPSALLGRISSLKSNGLTLERYLDDLADRQHDWLEEVVAKVYPRYQAKLRGARAFDFDDLILEATRLIQGQAVVREYLRRKYRWIFIDEFQDINQAQWELIKALAGTAAEGTPAHLFAVGDDDQAIYGFRGAHAGFLDDFQETYHPEVILLEDNYRSTECILRVANKIIERKTWGPVKQLRANSGEGDKPWAFLATSDVEEAMEIGSTIERLAGSAEYRYRDIAVLYRQNAQSRILEEVFTRLGLPHQVIGGQRFYARQEIKDVVAYLRLLNNDRDIAALERAINTPRRGIGDKTISEVVQVLEREDIGLWELSANPLALSALSARARASVLGFLELMSRLHEMVGKVNLKELLERVLDESGYELGLRNSKTIEDAARLDNLDELRGAVADWVDSYPQAGLSEYLEEQALIADVDKFDPAADSITLMTLHAAKGLEFGVVFLPGLEEGLLPHFRAIEEGSLDEELRLTYVGLTRAREKLFLSAAQVRRQRGDLRNAIPSSFLRHLDATLIEGNPRHLMFLTSELSGSGWSGESGVGWRRQMQAEAAAESSHGGRRPNWEAAESWSEPFDRPEPVARPRVKVDAPPSQFAPGDRVTHATFGEGTVEKITPAGNDNFVSIAFPEVGVKMLAESKAPLQKVDLV